MKTPNEKIILEAIKNKLDEGYIIYAEWDAGGDETPCYICYYKEESRNKSYSSYEYKGINIFEPIRNLIIDKLDLPNAGEIFNRGFGYIKISAENNLILVYTAKHYYHDEHSISESKECQETISMPTKSSLSDSLHRIAIEFDASIDEEMNFEFWMDFRILEGDEIELTQSDEDYYQAVSKSILKKYESELGKIKKVFFISMLE